MNADSHANRQSSYGSISFLPGHMAHGCNAVSLNGTSRDPENDTLSYLWTASLDVGHFVDERSEDTVWTAPAPGVEPQTVILTLTVTDGGGESATDSVIVTVRAH